MRGRGRHRRFSATVGDATLRALLGATGLVAFFDFDYAAGVTKDGSDLVSSLLSRVGGYTVETSGATRPTWGAQTPTGRRGATFSTHRLVAPNSTLAGIFDGSQAYSALAVYKLSTVASNSALWGVGSTSAADNAWEGCNGANNIPRLTRQDTGGTTSNTTGAVAETTSLVCRTSVYTGSAISVWLNGTLSINAGANTRAPVCDNFTVGNRMSSNTFAVPLLGELYALLLSTSQWSTAERTAYQAAAKARWRTP